jgi:hypothetical protein
MNGHDILFRNATMVRQMTRGKLTKQGLLEYVRSEALTESKTIRDRLDLLLAGNFATALVAAILGLAVSIFWLVPLRSSLWLDETGTVWAARGTLRDVWERAFNPGQPSVAFAIMTWWAVHIGGLDEITLRVPSLVASSVAALGVYLVARRFCDPHQSLLACALFATHSTVAFAAADARPYALALMAVVWSILMLILLRETGQRTYGFACEFLVGLSICFHYLCATMIPLQIWYLIRRDSVSRSVWRQVVSVGVVLGALLLVLLPHAGQLWRLRADHSFTGLPSVGDVLGALFYARLLAGFVAGLAVSFWIWPGFSMRTKEWFTRSHLFLLVWYLGPIFILFAISGVSEAGLFVPRYYLWGIPGLAILVASALSSIDPLPARRAAGLVVLVAFSARQIPTGPAAHGGQDWRGALRASRVVAARSDYTLLLRSGFPERPINGLGTKSTLDDPLMAPIAMYPVPGRAEPAPCWLKEADRKRWEGIVSSLVLRRAGFMFVSPNDWPMADIWLLGRMSGENYRISSLGDFAGITARVFEPRGPEPDLR